MKYTTLATLAAVFTSITSSIIADIRTYSIDPVHSGIDFKIRHFLNKVPGTFSNFSGEIQFDPENLDASKATAVIDVTSVNTRNDDRDAHLQNEDFFQADLYPKITFESTAWKAVSENKFEVTGNLTILDVTKPVTLEVTYLGEIEGRGKLRSGWEGKTTIDRTEWGLSYGSTVGTIGTEVDIELNIQAHRPIPE